MIYLTIAIPTYNGARTICDCIDSFINQLTDEVEVVISDNASTDGTCDKIKKYLSDKHFVYYKNEENVGMDRNFELAVQRARGQFVWILSDDDILVKEDAVKVLLDTIKKNQDNSVIFLNYENEVSPINKDYFSISGNEFYVKTNFKSTLISSTVVNKEYWISIDKSQYYGTYWIHIYYLLVANSRHPTTILHEVFLNQIQYKREDRRWGANGTFFLVGLDLAQIYSLMPKYKYDRNVCNKAVNYSYKHTFFYNIYLAKFYNLSVSMDVIKKCINIFWYKPSLWLINIPLLLMPNQFFKSIHSLMQLIKRKKVC